MQTNKLDLQTRHQICRIYVDLCNVCFKLYKTAGLADASSYHYACKALTRWIKDFQMDYAESPEILYLTRVNDVHNRILNKKFPETPSQNESKIFAERISAAIDDLDNELSKHISALHTIVTKGKIPTKLFARAPKEMAQEAAEISKMAPEMVRKFKIPEKCVIAVDESKPNNVLRKPTEHVDSYGQRFNAIKKQNIRRFYNTRHK